MLLFFLFVVDIIGQNDQTFILKGTINADSGTVILLPVGDITYYPENLRDITTDIKNQKFEINGKISHPYAFQIGVRVNERWKYISSIFFVEPTNQHIICNIDSAREYPLVDNKISHEFYNYLNLLKSSKDYEEFLHQYTMKNPNSYVSLWLLIKQISNNYTLKADSIYNNLTSSLISTKAGKVLKEKINNYRYTTIGNQFPNLVMRSTQNITTHLYDIISNHKYILVDFWFSLCPPCIEQFGKLKAVYSTNSSKKFQIVGISVDSEEKRALWIQTIKNLDLQWLQYLDVKEQHLKLLGVNSFPTNFLLDSSGKIIAKNISPTDLNNFLNNKE
ncbi:MAG: TlpA family protein disulfide reductase [Sphingobacteriia bacterium]|nr:TlpA family protein disulfide reductase [Sphingobacteriia bacterium]